MAVSHLRAKHEYRPLAGRHASLQNSLGRKPKNSSLGQQELHQVLEQREDGLNESAQRVDERGHFRRTHSSHSETYLRKDGLNTLSAYDAKAGLFGASLATGIEKGHMNIVGEVDQDNEADEENPQRKYKDPRRGAASAHSSNESAPNDIKAVVPPRPQRGIEAVLPLMDSSDREHLENLKKQMAEVETPADEEGDPGPLLHPKKLQLRHMKLTHTNSMGSNTGLDGRQMNSMEQEQLMSRISDSHVLQSDYNSGSIFKNNPHAIC